MPFDGLNLSPERTRLLQLRDLIDSTPDRAYSQHCFHTCALGHARRAGLFSFKDPYAMGAYGYQEGMKLRAAIYANAATHFGLPLGGAHFFGGPNEGGPNNRAEFLARIDAELNPHK